VTAAVAAVDLSGPVLSLGAAGRLRVVRRVVEETLASPPPSLALALKELSKERPEVLRDVSLGTDRFGCAYHYLEDHLGGIFLLRTRPPAASTAARRLRPAAAAAALDAAVAAAAAAAASSAHAVPGDRGAGKGAAAKKPTKKEKDARAAAVAAAVDAAAAALAGAAPIGDKLLETAAQPMGEPAGGSESKSSSNNNKSKSSSSSSDGSGASGAVEVLCSSPAAVVSLTEALARSRHPAELWLWRALALDVGPRLAKLASEAERLAKKEERAQRRMLAAAREASKLGGAWGGGLDDSGRRCRGGKVDYTYASYEASMREASRF